MAQEDLVVVHADSFVVRCVVSKQGSGEPEGAVAPSCEFGDERVQRGVFAEFVFVPGFAVGLQCEVDEETPAWTAVRVGGTGASAICVKISRA